MAQALGIFFASPQSILFKLLTIKPFARTIGTAWQVVGTLAGDGGHGGSEYTFNEPLAPPDQCVLQAEVLDLLTFA